MPPFDFIKRPAIGLGRRIGQGFEYLRDGLDPDTDPAELEQVRRALPPSFNGTQNPATQPRPVMPQPNAPMVSDRPPALINRPRLPGAAPQPSNIPGGEPPRPAFLDREIAPPTKSYGHERLDYRDQNAGRGFKQSMRAGLRGGLESMRNGGQGGGFLGGMLGNLIDPQGEADRAFAAGPGARILQRQEMQRDDELYGLKKRGLEAVAAENEAQAARYGRPTFKDAAWGTYDESTGQPGYTRPDRPALPPRPISVAPGGTLVDPTTGKPMFSAPNRPTAAPRPISVAPGGTLIDPATGKTIFTAPDRPERGQHVSPAEERMRTKEITGEVSRHNAMRQRVVQLGNQLSRLPKDDPDYPATVDAFNAEKAQFDAESARLQDTYGDDLENQDSSGAWPLFKVKTRAAAPTARPAPGGSKPISRAVVEKYAQDNGISYAEALRDAQADGYVVK